MTVISTMFMPIGQKKKKKLCKGQDEYTHFVSSLQVQLSLYTYLSAEFIGTATIYNTIRRVGTVLQIMHMLKYYYWAANPAESSCITPKGLGESRIKMLDLF